MKARTRAAVIAGLAAVLTVWPGSAMSDTVADQGIRYVALGDSRAAGPYLDAAALLDGCARADAGYPNLVARSLQVVSFTNVACTGARTEHLTSVPQETTTGPMPPQIEALAPDTDLVTVSIGGNDVGWSGLVSSCYTDLPGGDAHCRTDPGTTSRMTAALDALGPKVTGALTAVRQRAPRARVLLVGHGGVYGNRACWPNIPTSDADAVFVTDFFTRMNRVLAASAAAAGAEFVDVTVGTEGHDACAPSEQRWYEGRQSLSLARPLHPTAAGMRHMAQRVLDAVQRNADR
ncbi:SGNH/GDSL hydrolase family protein [Rhodococcus sp. Z13]|uniref:SGNH/GDSL hydrolase family protein n=1 Tax=Rhodococcus sacchari TaxID=2962047 RepID=A0ACD4DFK0_9NOCA|nr:SGNH/GDSL hydrolase family protein [Rhodococcus sp. Z13]UYP18766.1 SGNH/GDSL hydrolase family protein [Rhodococcus sp. Z13]